ncbi:hypothetical protein [Candidatus Williamhamiltonella defendens]|nr:hypothetical protein [Candidatus Hamiltonella defensa]
MPIVMRRVKEVIQAIQKVMHDDGYTVSDYQFIVQSYPSPIPPADRFAGT